MRLSAFVAKQFNCSRRFVKKAIADGDVLIAGVVAKKDIEIDSELNISLNIKVPNTEYNLADYLIKDYGDAIFLYKPPFMHTDRLAPTDQLCLADIVDTQYSLISRLDYEVDGVIAAVKIDTDFKVVNKIYLAWVHGAFDTPKELHLSIDAHKRIKVRPYEDALGARMTFTPIKTEETVSLIQVEIAKAARHQVRAACAYLGYPIIGDTLYGNAEKSSTRTLLHCAEVIINVHSRQVSCKSPKLDEFSGLY